MTELTKPVRRRVELLLDNRASARMRDHVVVTLHPDQTIGFRPSRCRREYRLPLVAAYRLAIQEFGKAENETKVLARKVRRGLL